MCSQGWEFLHHPAARPLVAAFCLPNQERIATNTYVLVYGNRGGFQFMWTFETPDDIRINTAGVLWNPFLQVPRPYREDELRLQKLQPSPSTPSFPIPLPGLGMFSAVSTVWDPYGVVMTSYRRRVAVACVLSQCCHNRDIWDNWKPTVQCA